MRGPKSIKSEMKREKLQPTPQKYKGSQETIMKNHMQIKWEPWRNGQILRKVQSPKTEPGRNRKYERSITCTKIESVTKIISTNKKSTTRWLHREILPNIQRRDDTYPSETIPKHYRGGNTSELIL